MSTPPTVDCPGCGRSQARQGTDTIYWCDVCQCQFDDDPDEGGDYSGRDPSWRLEREERRAVRRSAKKRRR